MQGRESPLLQFFRSVLRPSPQNQITFAGRERERELNNPVPEGNPQQEFLLLLQVSDPFALDAKEQPASRLGMLGFQCYRTQGAGVQELDHLRGILLTRL